MTAGQQHVPDATLLLFYLILSASASPVKSQVALPKVL